MQGVSPDISAASVHFLTARLSSKDAAALKATFVRPGFVEEWNNLDHLAKEFNKQLSGKEAATPSATWKLFTSADPQAVLWLGLTSKSPAIQAKYKNFFTVWPEARQKVPHSLLQELRITPEVPGYDEMISRLFLGVIDGDLETEEQLRAFLDPYSPPAPPPPVTIRRTRGSRKTVEAKTKMPLEAAFDGDALDLDDEEAGDQAADDTEEEDEGEPLVSLPPAAKKTAPAVRKSPPATEPSVKTSHQAADPDGKPSAAVKPEPQAMRAGVGAAKATPSPALHVVAPTKPAKVHVMAKPAKAASPPPNRLPGKKALPIKAAPAKAAAKAAPSKSIPPKLVRRPTAKPAAKGGGKKTVAKAPVKLHKKSEPVKKSAPVKKHAPARKHR
jgi:hypothetical protein